MRKVTYGELYREYVLFKYPSDVMYEGFGDDMREVRDESYRKYNLMGIICDWILGGKQAARSLSRSKRRKLTKHVMRRHRALLRRLK